MPLYRVLLLWWCCWLLLLPLAYAQQPVKKPGVQQSGQQQGVPLQVVLNKLRSAHKVSFLFSQKNIDGKLVTADVDYSKPIEHILEQVLTPSGLSFKKISAGYYSIFPAEVTGNQNSSSVAGQTFQVTGIVVDNAGEPLPGSIVFLSNSKYITTTNAQGNFILGGLPPGSYELTVKMIGFKTFKRSFIIDNESVFDKITLEVSVTELEEVVVNSAESRLKFLKTFTQYFIGESTNASRCKILNPDVLLFKYKKETSTLQARSDDFLEIVNTGLGYKIRYLLNSFEFNYKSGMLYYDGSAYFEELDGTAKDRKRWQLSRQVAYRGSVMHFLRSIFHNTLKQEGFAVFNSKDAINGAPQNPDGKLWDAVYVSNDFAYVNLKNKLYVLYRGELAGNYASDNRLGQVSTIEPLADSILIDKNGLFNSRGFLFAGYWSWENVAEKLPVDYRLDDKPPLAPRKPYEATASALPAVKSLVAKVDSFKVLAPAEKVFLHIDKPYYTNTDTIWLKGYLLNGSLNPSVQSGLLYTELVNDTGKVVIRQSLPARAGVSWGQMALDSTIVHEGRYTLRAYSNWMQNTGEESFFTRPVYISKANAATWLAHADSEVSNDGVNGKMNIRLTAQDGNPVRLHDLHIRLTEGNKTWLHNKMQTDIDGRLNINFAIPQNANGARLTLVADDGKRGGRRVVIPFNRHRAANTDVQFLPEGGNLVAGLVSKVGFKAVGEDGKGVDVSGVVVTATGEEIATFKSSYKGIGAFMLTPVPGQSYTAAVTLPNGSVKKYPLPRVMPAGLVLAVNNIPGRDSILLTVQATAEVLALTDSYTIIGQAGGGVCYASSIRFNAGGLIGGKVAKDIFPTGVVRFTLLKNQEQPIAERMVYIDHNDGLNISVDSVAPRYNTADSVSFDITVAGKNNLPVQGSFSVAVTDDEQVLTDSADVPNITGYMLLRSELKGDIEQPGYYFKDKTTQTQQHLDNLLLTQGWVGYSWQQILSPAFKPQYRPEKDIEVTGVVKRLKKTQPGLTVSLLSPQNLLWLETVTDSLGRFKFSELPKIDSPAYALKVKDKKGKVFEAVFEIDKFTPSPVSFLPDNRLMPWYVNSNAELINYNKQNIALSKAEDNAQGRRGINLAPVVITAKKIIKGSKNLNGPGLADQIVDPEEIIKAGKLTLYQLLLKKIKGFNIRTLNSRPAVMYYAIAEKQVKFVFDGNDLDMLFAPWIGGIRDLEHYYFMNNYLSQFNASDIKGIEVLYREAYTNKYKQQYESQALISNIPCITCTPPRYAPLVFVEITTWSGGGVGNRRTHGVELYRPLPVTWPKEFYKPKYTAAANPLLDLRSTVYWQPDIVTDERGIARVNFYTKSKPASYTVIIQGADLNGAVGQSHISISTKAISPKP